VGSFSWIDNADVLRPQANLSALHGSTANRVTLFVRKTTQLYQFMHHGNTLVRPYGGARRPPRLDARMEPQLYQELRTRVQALSDQAVRMAIPDGTSLATMKNRIRSVAVELNIPVTIRRVSGGLLFWRSTDEDVQQAKEVAGRLQTARSKGHTRGSRRRRT
jgi:hypothetical protein